MFNKKSANFQKLLKNENMPIKICFFLVILISSIICDCGIIKLLNSAEQFNGNPRTIIGKFHSPYSKELTLYGWVRLSPGMAIKNYVLFKLINLKNQTVSVTRTGNDQERILQTEPVSGSVYEELVKVSWQGLEDNFILQYPNGPSLANSEILLVKQAFQTSTSWRFWAISLDYGEERGQFFFKEFDTLDEKDHQLTNVKFKDFVLNEDFHVVLGGDSVNKELSFTGFMADIGMMTTFYEPLHYISLINPISRSFDFRGNLFTTDFSQLKNSKISLRSWGRSANASQTINPSLIKKLEELKNEKESGEKFGGSGIRVSSGDSVSISNVDFSSSKETVINKLFFTMNFSFFGEFPVNFNIVSYGDTNSPNTFIISLVEENSETVLKVFTQDRINLLPLNQELSDYVYNPTLKNPRVLKVQLITADLKVLTFLGKEQLAERDQHQITIGIIHHDPNTVRIYYSNAKKQFSLTEEHKNLPFNLEKQDLRFFNDNNSVTGGSFVMNYFHATDSFFDFYLTYSYPQTYRNSCYSSVSSHFFLLSESSKHIQNGLSSGSTQIQATSNISSSSYSSYALYCDHENGFVKYQGNCYHSCPNGSFYFNDYRICKSCRQVTCDSEIKPISMNVSLKEDGNPNDSLITLSSRSSSTVYKIPHNGSSQVISQSPFNSSNLLNLSNVPITVSSDSLTEDIDYKILNKKSGFSSGIYESEVQLQLINPNKSTTFNIEPSMPDPPENFQYRTADKNPAFFSRQGLEVDTSAILSCTSNSNLGRILGIIFLVLFFLLVAIFIITNCLFIDNYIKWRLLMTCIGAHLIAFVVLVNKHLGRLSFGFTEIIYKILIK
jgi:hypothetical protein